MDIENQILTYIQSLVHDKAFRVKTDTSLIAKGVLDSLDILKLIEFIESTFHIKLTGEDLDPNYFETAGEIIRLIENKLSAVKE